MIDGVFLQIPPEVFTFIARKLATTDIEALSLTCKRWHAAVRGFVQITRLHLPHTANSNQMATEARRLFPAASIVISSSTTQVKLWPGPVHCNILQYSTGQENKFRRGLVHPKGNLWFEFSPPSASSSTREELGKNLQEIKHAQASLSRFGVSCELVMYVKSRDLKREAFFKHDLEILAPRISQLHADEKGLDVLSMLQLNNLHTLSLTMSATPKQTKSLAEALANLPSLQELYLHCTSIRGAPLLPLLLTELAQQTRGTAAAGITTLGIALDVDRPFELEIPAVTLAGITALELTEGVVVDMIPDSLASLRLNIQNNAGAEPMLTQLQHSAILRLTLQHAVSLNLLPANLQSLTFVDPFVESQIDCHGVSNALGCLTQLRELKIGNFLTSSVVSELLLVSLPVLVTFGFRVHHLNRLYRDPFWDQCPHVLYRTNDRPVSLKNCCVAHGVFTTEPMFLQLPQIVANLGASFGKLRVIQVCSLNPGRHATIGLNCNLLTSDHFPHLFGLTCKLWNSDVVLHNLPRNIYAVSKASSSY